MLTVDVPLNTMLADLDETLRDLLRGELERHGFEGVDIAFDAPAREWSGQLSKPTVNIFLYDLREAEALRTSEWSRDPARRAHVRGPPADGHGVLLRRHRVDAGGRGRAPAALAGARDLLRLSRAARRTRSTGASPTARRPGRSRPASGRARARSRTSGARSAASTRCRWTTSCGSRSSRAPSSSAARKSARRPSARGCPTARRARSSRCTAPSGACQNKKGEPLGQRLGHAARRRHLDRERRRRPLPLRPPAARPSPAAGADRGRPGGRRAA